MLKTQHGSMITTGARSSPRIWILMPARPP
jgi:hypothetical protein